MFFIVTKLIAAALTPSNSLVTVCLACGVYLSFRPVRWARMVFLCCAFILAVCGFSPLGNLMLAILESRVQIGQSEGGSPDGILVLGGVLDEDLSAVHSRPVLGSGVDRIVAAAELAHRYPRARVVYSGGSPKLFAGQASEADYALSLLESCGIAAGRVQIESRSRNTLENAVFSKELIAPRQGERWLMVTSAFHMPRAIGIFRKVGFPVEPVPVDWRTAGLGDLFRLPGSFAGGLSRVDLAAREWGGLLVYWWSGKMDTLLPR